MPDPERVNEVPLALALSPDGTRLAEITNDGRVWWWESGTWQLLPTRNAPDVDAQYFKTSRPYLQFARDGRTLFGTGFADAVSAKDMDSGALMCWNLNSNSLLFTGSDAMFANSRLTSGVDKSVQRIGNTYHIWDLNNQNAPILLRSIQGSQQATQYAKTQLPHGYALSADGSQLLVATAKHQLQFWDVASRKMISQTPPAPGIRYPSLTIRPSANNRFVILSDYIGIAVWDQIAKRWTKRFQSGSGLEAICWVPNGKSLWVSGFLQTNTSGETQQVSAPALQTLRTLPVIRGPVAVSSDGHTLATRATKGNGVWLWNID